MIKLLAGALVGVLVALGAQAAAAPAEHRQLLPRVAQQSTGAEPVLLVEGDHGFVAALNLNGRFFLVVQQRPSGVARFVEHVGTSTIVDVDDPLIVAALAQMLPSASEPAPAFTLSGPKHGSAALVADGQSARLYYTGRRPNMPTDPFHLWWVRYTPAP